MQVDYDTSDLEELNKRLRKFMESTEDLKEVHARAASTVEREAERRVKVRSGQLKSSIRSSGQAKSGVIRAGNKGKAPYAGPIHWGWPKRNIKASLFMTKARDAKMPEVLDILEDGLDKLAKKHI